MRSYAVVLLIIVVCGVCEEIPKEINTCSRSDENFNKCLAVAIQDALVVLKDGNSNFDLPQLEPFSVKNTQTETIGGTSTFYLKSSLKNAKIYGLTEGKVLRAAAKFNKNYIIKTEAEFDQIAIIGNYTMNGKILVLPINGEGRCNITLKDVIIRTDSVGKFITKDGETYIDIQTFKLKMTPKRVFFNFENLFKNDKKLSDTINSFMNQEWQLVSENVMPSYEEKFGEQLIDAANKIYHKVPLKNLFRD